MAKAQGFGFAECEMSMSASSLKADIVFVGLSADIAALTMVCLRHKAVTMKWRL